MATHMTGPVLNATKAGGLRQWFNDLNLGQEPALCVFQEDFLAPQSYQAADWIITKVEAGSGSSTQAIAALERSGALKITNDDAAADVNNLQQNTENWSMVAGKQLWMEMRLKVSAPATASAFVGLAVTDTTARDASDRVGFSLASGSAVIQLNCAAASTGTNVSSGITAVADTYNTLGIHWDGKNRVQFFIDRSMIGEISANIPSRTLAFTLNIQNGAAAAQILTVDYIYVAQER